MSHGLALPSPDLPALPQVPIHPPRSAPHLKSLPCGHVSSVLWFPATSLWPRLWACAPWPSMMLHQLVRGSLPRPCSGKCPSPNPAPHLHPAMSQLFQHSPALQSHGLLPPLPPSALAWVSLQTSLLGIPKCRAFWVPKWKQVMRAAPIYRAGIQIDGCLELGTC